MECKTVYVIIETHFSRVSFSSQKKKKRQRKKSSSGYFCAQNILEKKNLRIQYVYMSNVSRIWSLQSSRKKNSIYQNSL